MIKVLFLCLGNICRSPMAEAVFRKMVIDRGLEEVVQVDSAGIGGWHAGQRPHRGTLTVLSQHNIPHDWIRSRQIQKQDLEAFDYIVAMDAENMADLRRIGTVKWANVFRLLDVVDDAADKDVPDPYYTGNFDHVYVLIRSGCAHLLDRIVRDLASSQHQPER